MSTQIYTGPIQLTTNTTINFFSVDDQGNVEPLKTISYTIVNDGNKIVTPNIGGISKRIRGKVIKVHT